MIDKRVCMDGYFFYYVEAYLIEDHTLALADRVFGNETEHCSYVVRTR